MNLLHIGELGPAAVNQLYGDGVWLQCSNDPAFRALVRSKDSERVVVTAADQRVVLVSLAHRFIFAGGT